jgi:hypothetical protein
MMENFAQTVQEISEKIKDVQEYVPDFLKGREIKCGSEDICKPFGIEGKTSLTDYQREILKEEHGWSEEKIDSVGSWENAENVFEGREYRSFNEANSDVFSDLNTMKTELGKTYGEIKEDKPPNSPNISKWFENGGSIEIKEVDGKPVWTYSDSACREVPYVDGYPDFPPEAKHPVVDDIDIGKFTGDRNEDKRLYLEKLEEEYGLNEIPEGYALHHDSTNGNMQLVQIDWHKEFTHAGGHSKFKEV